MEHPTEAGVEKYIYDINLCSYYVWRWNVSADFDKDGHLLQVYLNGDPIFPAGSPKRDVRALNNTSGKKPAILHSQRSRPEAYKGESSLAYLMFDADGDLRTIDDQVVIGAGPSRVDPVNLGKLVVYNNVDPWRSIFDSDRAAQIVPYSGDCTAVESAIASKRTR